MHSQHCYQNSLLISSFSVLIRCIAHLSPPYAHALLWAFFFCHTISFPIKNYLVTKVEPCELPSLVSQGFHINFHTSILIKVGVQSQPGCTSTCICNTPKYQRNKTNKESGGPNQTGYNLRKSSLIGQNVL